MTAVAAKCSGVTMDGGHVPPAEVCDPRVPPPIQNFEKIGPHSGLQDIKVKVLTCPPRKSGAPPSAPGKLDPGYATVKMPHAHVQSSSCLFIDFKRLTQFPHISIQNICAL